MNFPNKTDSGGSIASGERLFFDMFKSLRSGLLVALVLVSAVAVVASPAFATPNITDSSGTAPVSPFLTPIGNTTTSSLTATEDRTSRFTAVSPLLGGANIVISCASRGTGHILSTHTRAVIDTLRFTNCTSSAGGTVVVTTNADSVRCPYFLHMARSNGFATSWDGTFNLSVCGVITIDITGLPFGASCRITITASQSVKAFETDDPTTTRISLPILDSTVRFRRTGGTVGCVDDTRTARQQGFYTITSTTARDTLRGTAAS